ncbi:MAG: hypothetical protein K2L86_00345 [Lachnospiraceae bacterium]|nr:hypothetical protein [Lachnospiraceae bacterium]
MKRMMFKAFGKKLFGANYERMPRGLLAALIVFLGLRAAGCEVRIAPVILYLMTSTFTAGVMWQALSSKDHAEMMQNMLMLPFEERDFVFAYVASLGVYTVLTKTAMLLAVVFAVGEWSVREIAGSACCAVNAILMAAAIDSIYHNMNIHIMNRKKHRISGWCVCCFWTAAVSGVILLMWDAPWFLILILVNSAVSIFVLQRADAYSLYAQGHQKEISQQADGRTVCERGRKLFCSMLPGKRTVLMEAKSGGCQSGRMGVRMGTAQCGSAVWRYLFRYLRAHKNYLVNTVILCGVACVLPSFLGTLESEGIFAQTIGFAVLSMNTPLCILLSCDPDLEQAVRVLPGQERIFCVSYGLFIVLWNGIADALYLCSWQIQLGGVTGLTVLSAAFFAVQSAVLSVLLEWFYPVRGWKIESDLWHHPRKYLVSAGMLLLAGIVAMQPMLIAVFVGLLGVEVTVLLEFAGKK